MPFGVATIFLVAILVVLGLFCIIYSFHFRSKILGQGLFQLNYFTGPWIIRIFYILFAVWWGTGEIIRLNLLRHNGKTLYALNSKLQDNVCKCYIISNLGFAEPCLFLTLIFLLRASVHKTGMLSPNWNWKTASSVLLFCFPMLILQLVVILIGPKYRREVNPKLASYFVEAASTSKARDDVALCTYPLLSTILLGIFATAVTAYLFWLGRQILHLVINKVLQRRVYTLIFCISSSLPLRVLLLGLSVLSNPERLLFDAMSFLAFLSLVSCAGVGIYMLVYLPIADSLSLRSLQRCTGPSMRAGTEYAETISLIANGSPLDESTMVSPSRVSSASGKRGSISFHKTDKDEVFVELSLFNPSQQSPTSLVGGV